MKSCILAIAIAVVAFVSSVTQALDQPWYIAYDQAVKSVRIGDYASGEEMLRGLIQARAMPQANAHTYGMWTIDYTPFFYLGVALDGQSKHREALRAFRVSEKWGVAERDPAKKTRLEEALGPPRGTDSQVASAR